MMYCGLSRTALIRLRSDQEKVNYNLLFSRNNGYFYGRNV